jgi:hypothetical protein
MVNASSLTAHATAHPGFIGLDVFPRVPADTVLIGAHHTNAELMKYLEGGFVARQTELPLELDGRHAGRMAGDLVDAQNHTESGVCVRSMTVPAAMAAAKRPKARGNVPWTVSYPVVRTDEPSAPSCALKVGSTRRFIREQALKLRKRVRERQIVPLKYVDCHDRPTFMQILKILPVVGWCDNRISTK